MRHIIRAAFDRASDDAWLTGPPGSGDNVAARALRIAQTDAAGDMQAARVDRSLYLLAGQATATIGDRTFEIEADTLVFLPAGTPHRIVARGRAPADFLDMFAPAPPLPLLEAALPRPVDGADALVRPLDAAAFTSGGFAYQALLSRATGSQHLRLNMVEVQPGAGSPDFHIHAFDQFYMIIDGEMTVEVGRERFVAGPGSFVLLPAGLVHRNYNRGPGRERHLTLIAAEPAEGAIFDYAVTIHEREAEFIATIPDAEPA